MSNLVESERIMLIIREEHSDDIDYIYNLEAEAFGRPDEADLIIILREADALILSQVALLDDEIVGHAAYSLVSITVGDSIHHSPALGPIAVAPAHQRQGVGSALMHAGMKAMTEMGYGLLFLVGHVTYYPRFGFQPALPLGFTSDYIQPGGRHEHFMVCALNEQVTENLRGHVRFHPAFDAV